jgi:acyl carrier protein
MKEKLLSYISEVLANETLEDALEVDDDLLGSGILDSLGVIRLISFIETEFNFDIKPEEMVIENFMTVSHVLEFLETKS